METVLPSLLAVAMLLVGAATAFRTADQTVDRLAASWKDMANVAQDRIRTRLDISAVTVDGDGFGVRVTVRNDGQSTVLAFERMDVILEYTTTAGVRVIAPLSFVPGVPGAESWTVWSIQPDSADPGFLNPGEEMVQFLRVSSEISPGAINRVTIAAPNGATASAQFAR